MKSIAIIGLGLIGGSMAKAVKSNSCITVIGWNRNQSVLQTALKDGAIDKAWDKKGKLYTELVIIALPPAATLSFLEENAHLIGEGVMVSDVCGVKTRITAECEKICLEHGLEFIGGHPMAGKERGGYFNTDRALFEGASYIITPTERTTQRAIMAMKELAEVIKIRSITVTEPEQHDKMIAFTSQLPHVLAGAYVKSPSCTSRKGFSAGSYMDVSRVATADEKLWTELFLQNRENLCNEIDILIKNLVDYRDAIKSCDRQALEALIKQSSEIKKRDNL